MLDNESSDSETAAVTADTEASTPAPRRRRRAASRPAGPPVVPEPTPEPVADVPEDQLGEGPEDQDAEQTENETAEQTESQTAEQTESQTAEQTESQTAEQTEPEAAETAEVEDEGETPTGVVASDPVFDSPFKSTAPTTSRRRRASRSAVTDPFAVPQIDVSALRPQRDDTNTGDTNTGDTNTGDTNTGDTSTRDTSTREASTREASTREASTRDTSTRDANTRDTKAAAATETPVAEEAKPAPAPRRRRRATRGQSAPVEAPAADESTSAETGPEAAAPEAARPEAAAPEAVGPDATEVAPAADEGDPLAAALDQLAASKAAASDGDSNEADETDDNEGSDDDDENGGSRRRRRRRGGRRRRKSSDGDEAENTDSDSAQPSNAEDQQADTSTSGDDSTDQDNDDDGSGRRRRRRRRRSGEDSDETARRRANDAVTGIDGSTRLEAKRQRRREGREAGRRRTPILSEAEFLARRESVKRTMVIRQRETLAQIAVLEDDVLVEHYVDHSSTRSLIGNVYLGRVQNVLPSMEAAFIDIGQGRNAVLYAGEVDWSAFDQGGRDRKIESVLKSGQTILVQVTKDPVGAKGARLTHHVSLPGRYIVYSPGGHLSGISRKLPDTERKRLKQILSEHIDDSASVIVRTAAEGATEDELVRDITRLKTQWDAIEKKIKNGGAPKALHTEPDPTVRIVRDLFTEDFSELVISGIGGSEDAYDNVTGYVEQVAPHLLDRVKRWDGDDVFVAHRIDEQIAKALERKVHLPSGGSLIIDRTEAMTVIDVNTGKFTGSGGNLEATVTSNNLEAAEEIVRQLRLRDLGGIIVIDFIDMVLPSNRDLLLRRLVECLGRDRTRHQVAEVTSLGLVQMTRKRIGTGLGEAFTTACEDCQGKGFVSHIEPVEAPAEEQQHNGQNSRRNRGGAKQSRSDRTAKSRTESASTPPRQPLPKVMPPPPPGLAPVAHNDSDGLAEEVATTESHEASVAQTETPEVVEPNVTGTLESTPDATSEPTETGESKPATKRASTAKTTTRKATTRKTAASKKTATKAAKAEPAAEDPAATSAQAPTAPAEEAAAPADGATPAADPAEAPKRTRKTAARSPRARKAPVKPAEAEETSPADAAPAAAPTDDVAAALGALVATHTNSASSD